MTSRVNGLYSAEWKNALLAYLKPLDCLITLFHNLFSQFSGSQPFNLILLSQDLTDRNSWEHYIRWKYKIRPECWLDAIIHHFMQFDVSRKLEKIDNFIFGQTYLKFADYISTSKILFNHLYTIDKIKCLQRIEEQLLKVSASYGKSSS